MWKVDALAEEAGVVDGVWFGVVWCGAASCAAVGGGRNGG